jgi:hypothetical protein
MPLSLDCIRNVGKEYCGKEGDDLVSGEAETIATTMTAA